MDISLVEKKLYFLTFDSGVVVTVQDGVQTQQRNKRQSAQKTVLTDLENTERQGKEPNNALIGFPYILSTTDIQAITQTTEIHHKHGHWSESRTPTATNQTLYKF